MSLLTAAVRPYTLQTALHDRSLRVRSFTGEEAVSRLFRFRLLVDTQAYIPTPQLLGQNVVFLIRLRPGQERRFLAKIHAVEELGMDEHKRASYALELVPRLWALTQSVRSRVFENLDALHIVEQVFAGSGIQVRAHTRENEPVRPYCVQYFESDFDFVARLLEEEGYVYQCGADQDQPTFDIECFPSAFPKLGRFLFHEVTGGPEERIGSWQKTRVLTATSLSARDHYFQSTSPVLGGKADAPAAAPANSGWEALNAGWSAPVDHFPGQWAHLFEEIRMNGAESAASGYTDFGDNRMWYALQQAVGSTSGSAGTSDCPRLSPLSLFDLMKHPTASGEHFVVSVRHEGSQALDHSGDRVLESTYQNHFTAVPYTKPMMYLPPRATRKPLIYGCQTAKVVGAADDDEIWTDKYGRVQVQFWWDRDSTRSCWIRVATPWAGNHWGMQHVPRVGQEVVVTFLDGDPDRPLIVGSVYNPSQMPPFPLPDNQTQSGIRTHSTPGGTSEESNEIRFEDSKGHEEMYLHAQKDRTEVVENDAVRTVGNDSSELVSNNRYDAIAVNFHASTAGEKREVVNGKSSLTVGDNAMMACGKKLGIAASEIHLKASKIVIEADAISIRTSDKGSEFIHLAKGGGITIDSKGEQVWINCGGKGSPEDGCYETPSAPVNPFAPSTDPKAGK